MKHASSFLAVVLAWLVAGEFRTKAAPTDPLVGSPVHHVSLDGGHVPPFSTWETAATNIQDAIDVSVDEHTVLISNGTYFLDEEIVVDQDILIQSLSGASHTVIDGRGASRCMRLGSSECVVSGLTITHGYSSGYGGGVLCSDHAPILTKCRVVDNHAEDILGLYYETAEAAGGGIRGGTLVQCVIEGNSVKAAGSSNDNLAMGGGASRSVVARCVVKGNQVFVQGGGGLSTVSLARGGGVDHCFVTNSLIVDNLVDAGGSGNGDYAGGGAYEGTAVNCTFYDNTVRMVSMSHYRHVARAGGMADGTALNSIFHGNEAEIIGQWGDPIFPDDVALYPNIAGAGSNCCDSMGIGLSDGYEAFRGLEHGMDGNLTNQPFFVDAAAGDFRLRPSSPCVNWGNNGYADEGVDLDGNARIVDGHVDMGCYEYQGVLDLSDSDGDKLLDEWERKYFGGNTDPNRDDDGDGLSTGEEWIAGFDPTNHHSVFTVTNVNQSVDGFVVEWLSVSGRTYRVDHSTNLPSGFAVLADGLDFPVNTYTDTLARASDHVFYRVVVGVGDAPAGMVFIPGGTNTGVNPLAAGESYSASYPSNYNLAVEAFFMDPAEISIETWNEVHDWATARGYVFSHPGASKAAGHPVHSISWYDAARWCNARSEKDGRSKCYNTNDWSCVFGANGYRLPTAEEWEYAARGGLSGKRFPWGDDVDHGDANYRGNSALFTYDLSGYAADTFHPAYETGAPPYSCPPLEFPANGFGARGTSGNLWEWCDDEFAGERSMLGGSYGSRAEWIRCGARNFDDPEIIWNGLGFRAVCRP